MPETPSEAIKRASARLSDAGIETARLDAEILLVHLLKCERIELLVRQDKLDSKILESFGALIERRLAGEPVAYITGVQAFWQHDFRVNAHTLIPRQDTETLVEVALRRTEKRSHPHILELGVGSGCVLLSLLSEREAAEGVGTDISSETLAVAGENARLLGLSSRTDFFKGDWFKALPSNCSLFDCIVSNPPYIPAAHIATLMHEVREHEPLRALEGGKTGLEAYKIILAHASSYLADGGLLAVEVGAGQARHVADLMIKNGLCKVEITKDLPGIERVVSARKLA